MNTEWFDAAHNGDVEVLARLIKDGTDVNAVNDAKGWTALMFAAENGHV